MPPGAAGRGGPAGYRSSGGPTPQALTLTLTPTLTLTLTL